MSIIIVEDKCVGCGLCIKSCPYDAIKRVDGKVRITDDCRMCGVCLPVCPVDAIERVGKEERVGDLSEYRGVLVFGEQRNSRISPVVYELIGKGRELADKIGEELECVVLGEDVTEEAENLINYGVDKVYVYDDPSLAVFREDPYVDIIVDLLRKIKPNIFLLGATAIGRSIAPRIASRIKTGLTADCTELDIDPETGLLLQTRPAFGGNVMATIICPRSRPQMATVRYKVMKRAERRPGYKGEVVKMRFDPEEVRDRVEVLEISDIGEGGPSITEADIIVSGGRGLGGPEGFKIIRELADLLGGAVGASRAAVDEGWIAYPHQIGLSGRTVRPKIYIACGISGSVQHLAGMKGSEFIIAINKDPSAPILKIADMGLVGDLYEVIPKLIDRIRRLKKG